MAVYGRNNSAIEIPPNFKSTMPPRKRAKTKEEKEQRKIERILRNRRAAHQSREKKRLHLLFLEHKCRVMEQILSKLGDNINSLLSSNDDDINLLKEYQSIVSGEVDEKYFALKNDEEEDTARQQADSFNNYTAGGNHHNNNTKSNNSNNFVMDSNMTVSPISMCVSSSNNSETPSSIPSGASSRKNSIVRTNGMNLQQHYAQQQMHLQVQMQLQLQQQQQQQFQQQHQSWDLQMVKTEDAEFDMYDNQLPNDSIDSCRGTVISNGPEVFNVMEYYNTGALPVAQPFVKLEGEAQDEFLQGPVDDSFESPISSMPVNNSNEGQDAGDDWRNSAMITA